MSVIPHVITSFNISEWIYFSTTKKTTKISNNDNKNHNGGLGATKL